MSIGFIAFAFIMLCPQVLLSSKGTEDKLPQYAFRENSFDQSTSLMQINQIYATGAAGEYLAKYETVGSKRSHGSSGSHGHPSIMHRPRTATKSNSASQSQYIALYFSVVSSGFALALVISEIV